MDPSGELPMAEGDRLATARDRASQARLACVGVTVRFGGLVAVHDVDLEVPPAAIVGLVGPNGAGKSTLFGVLSGLIRPWHGKVLLDREDVTGTSPQARAARGLARTFQHPELFTGLSVRDHLVLARRAKRSRSRIWADLLTMASLRPADQMERADVDELIELLGLGSVAEGPALGLPLGLARLVELGRALATSPTVLLLDEPSSGLDSSETEQFATTLRNISRERGISILLVEHDVELVMRLSSTVYVLDFGVLIARDSPDQVRADPAVRAAYLGEQISGTGAEASGETPDPIGLSSAPSGMPPSPEPSGESAALAAEHLSVRYGDAVALTSVSFQVGRGKALAVLGANGAGKSSLARALSGLVPVSSGKVVFDGKQIDGWPAYRIRRAGLVHLPEGRGVFRGLSVIDNLRMAAATLEGRQARRQGVELALEIFPILAARRNQRARLLSGGEQQMLSLARALATSPSVLVADEMSLGLAPKLVDVVFDGLNRARQAGVTVIMIEQYVHRALEFADACLVLQRGSVAWSGPATAAGNEVLSRYLGDAMTVAS
jgi:ABC-type branched-subunit amino acid transport system ATPase component